MRGSLSLDSITQTVFVKRAGGTLHHLHRFRVSNTGDACHASVRATLGPEVYDMHLGRVPPGGSQHDVLIPEATEHMEAEAALVAEGQVQSTHRFSVTPPRRWVVHVVQLSHHDVGYTDLPSNVLPEHDRWLDEAITTAEESDGMPEEAKFRIVIEQNWSLNHFLAHAPRERADKLLGLIGAGRFEVTALFGNMISELCGHEVLIRTLYHAFALKRRHGIPILSAEHNDVPGMSWGLSQILTDAGIRIFCPGLPEYYSWFTDLDMQSFWDQETIFGHSGPGAFWWEAPSGKRLLFWCNNSGCGGDSRAALPGLAGRLRELEQAGYPYSVIRWPVTGGARDNSPYSAGYVKTVQEWNETWAYPHLQLSTNTRFHGDLLPQLPAHLPVHRGELPGQDYPIGATSTSAPTAANRNNHITILSAEKMATAASLTTDYAYQDARIRRAYEEVLWYDEHTWGHHFPAGPTARASRAEKDVHAFRAEALIHDVANKALARIADAVDLDREGLHLVVFNTTSAPVTAPVWAPLREIDNCGSTMAEVPADKDPEGVGYLRGVLLTDRWHATPPQEVVDGEFDLIDVATGDALPFQIRDVPHSADTVPFAAERLGLGSGSKRYGLFEHPAGITRDLIFVATDIPACGYRTYRLEPRKTTGLHPGPHTDREPTIENEYYKVTVQGRLGTIRSIVDKETGRELVDGDCPYPFHTPIARDPHGKKFRPVSRALMFRQPGPVCQSLESRCCIHGHGMVFQKVALYDGVRAVYLETRVLKDPTPLLDVRLSFPFAFEHPTFRYEGALAVMNPIQDYLPGSYSDTIAVQNWVKVSDPDFSVLWSSRDAPVAGMGGFWPGYVSPAHRCFVDERAKHPPLAVADLTKGWIFSHLFYNNFGTNFAVSQVADVLFRFVITTRSGDIPDNEAALLGAQAMTPVERILTARTEGGGGSLSPTASFVEIEGDRVELLTFKQAEDGEGYILRLWNSGGQKASVHVRLPFVRVARVGLAAVTEEELHGDVTHDDSGFSITIDPATVATVRVVPDSPVMHDPL